MNRQKLILTLIVGITTRFSAFSQDDILGVWFTQDRNSKVEVYKQDGKYFGKIVWLKDSLDRKGNAVKDIKNPERALRQRSILGINILEDLAYRHGQWIGELYAPRRGMTLEAEVSLDEEKNELVVSASYGGFGREQIWSRFEP
ncbi:MAG: DUF2147 domain-containing protein [Cyclobacteriaceae bacterium]